jgi:hypothetical protein
MAETKNFRDWFFARIASGGLILRLLVVWTALLVGLLISIAALAMWGAEIHWPDFAVAFALLAVAFSLAHWIETIPVDPTLVLARLSATTLIRLGLPLAGVVIMDRFVQADFLRHTLVFWLVGFFLGLTTSSLISWGRLSQQA